MNLEDAINKCSTDLNEIMQSIESVKGQRFVEILAIHINFCTLVKLTKALKDEEMDDKLREAITHTVIVVASSTLGLLSNLAGIDESGVDDLISWGDRLEKMVSSNISLVKGSE